MARISAKSALVLFLQVTVLILVLSPTANCLSLDDREQLKQQLTEEFVSKTNSIIFLMIPSNFNYVLIKVLSKYLYFNNCWNNCLSWSR